MPISLFGFSMGLLFWYFRLIGGGANYRLKEKYFMCRCRSDRGGYLGVAHAFVLCEHPLLGLEKYGYFSFVSFVDGSSSWALVLSDICSFLDGSFVL